MQTTLRRELHFEGVGLHTGAACAAWVEPAPPNLGLRFLVDGTEIPATADYVVDTRRATVIGCDGVSVSTTEHLLSALFAMGVCNARIRLEGPEVPALDGSAAQFVGAILEAGTVEQTAVRDAFELEAPCVIERGDRMVLAFPAADFRVRFVADFPHPIGTQYLDVEITPQRYVEEIAPARTFAYLHEIEALRADGLARGGSLDNALVFAPAGPMQPLRWPDEAVRHKVLDLIGDLALLGAWPRCEVVAIKSGHSLHASLTQALRASARAPHAG
ncbi:MAG: UDP-3-O-[3-hydroxymyristoyl] N-acetylglucosamine deacetylase [Candidatus Eremiobacteraeota bacterium]|nr:UDP-3-O-[3-hydroxymyristoyl] N-acetylglucosamine deacetylase [Candidatus Eremiobacteraeota bacterium]